MCKASQVALVVKNPPSKVGDVRDTGSIPESGRSPGEGNGSPYKYSCLENPVDREAWQSTVHIGLPRVQHNLTNLANMHKQNLWHSFQPQQLRNLHRLCLH